MNSPAPGGTILPVDPINTFVNKPQQIWNGGSGVQPFIFNNDEVNTLYIGSQSDVLRQDATSCIPVQPLSGQVWPDANIYAFAPTSVNVLIIPGATSVQPGPVQIAVALAAAGLATATNQILQNTAIPDNISTTGINGSLPSLLDTEVLSPASGVWGPFTNALPAACGSYLIAITPGTPADPFCSDFTVDHLDDNSNIVHTDFFGAAYGGSWPGSDIVGSAIQMSGPTLLRGNIYGTQLRISGLKAAAAMLNTITGSSGIIMSGFTYRLYTLPYNVPDAMPKMSNGSASLLAQGDSPSNLLAAFVNFPLTAGSTISSPIVPYAGPAVLNCRCAANPASVEMQEYSVANGTTPLGKQVADMIVSNTAGNECVPFNISACLNILAVVNNSAATSTINVSLVAATSA